MDGAKHVIVTISRESGSGGRKIGKMLAEKLGWSLYDKELLDMTAEETGYAAETVADVEHAHSSMFSMGLGRVGIDYIHSIPLNEQLYKIQCGLIRSIADRENAVIVGRCGDSALQEYAPTIAVFIQGSEDKRINRVMKRENLSYEDAKKRMKLIDKTRATYHDYFSETRWGERENYKLIINSDIGEEATAEVLFTYVKSVMQGPV